MLKKASFIFAFILILIFTLAACDSCNGGYGFDDGNGLRFVLINDGTEYAVYGSYNKNSFENIVIPSEFKGKPVTDVGGFYYNRSIIKTVELPESITVISSSAFSNCESLTDVSFSEGVKPLSIGANAFSGCVSLKSIELPSNVTSLGKGVFKNCNSLENLTVASGNTVYKSDGNCITVIATNTLIAGCNNSVVPDYVTVIGEEVFYNDKALSGIAFAENSGLTYIEKNAFANCESLINIDLPESVETIGESVFAGSALKSISFVENSRLINIGDMAFQNCKSLTAIEIPESVMSIGDFAFSNCESLSSLTISSNVKYVGNRAFFYHSPLTIYSEAESISDWWHILWNYSNRPVVWGCTLSGDKAYVVSFTKTETSIHNPAAGINAPYRKDYTFGGWAIEPGGEAEYAADEIANAPDGVTLYAVWNLTV